MHNGRFHSVTLGCKLNQFDTAAIEAELRLRGFTSSTTSDQADVLIVNTCTVTHRADSDARKLIRRLRRDNPDAKLLVTGCYAERDAAVLRAVGGVDRVFGNVDKPRVGAILDDLGLGSRRGGAADEGDRGCSAAISEALHFGRKARAFLRVQDGCRLQCAYCIIPQVRGASRSVPLESICGSARRLWDRGFKEIVLTGVNTGDWGLDLEPRQGLVDLLQALLADAGPRRLRLNSLEPRTITDPLIALMAGEPRIAPHLQVPLQSGSDAVLTRMRRNYRRELYLERLQRLHAAMPHIGLGADVIVGFPGETDADFEATYRVVDESPLSYLHVFSWSGRPGTHADGLPDRLPERVISERNRRLRELAAKKGERFRRRFIGQRLDAVVLETDATGEVARALTGNFFDVHVSGPAPRGALVSIEIDAVETDRTVGRVVGRPDWIGGAAA